MKYYIIAGEPSGDLHGSNIIKELRKMDENANFRFWGGELMQAEAGESGSLVTHYKNLAFMGFWEVFIHLFTILGYIARCKKDIEYYYPDVLVLIDYPGFNLKIAKFASKLGIKVVYYISPKVWVWNASRVKKIKKYVDKMMCILPFEKDFYTKYHYIDEVFYVGNPIIDAVADYHKMAIAPEDFLKNNGLKKDKPIMALLPGSRKQEIRKILPHMLKAAQVFSADYQIVIAGAPNQKPENYQNFLKKYPHITVVENQTYSLLNVANLALVKSGTSTLEAALFKVPQVVCYRTGWLSYCIAYFLVKVKFIALINLIANRLVVKELIQWKMNKKNITREIQYLINNRTTILKDYDDCMLILGSTGASHRAARIIFMEAILFCKLK